MTILFYLKPYWYSFPPSGVPDEDADAPGKRKRKAASEREAQELKQKLKRKHEDDLLLVVMEWLSQT